jgi:hypothetical protein
MFVWLRRTRNAVPQAQVLETATPCLCSLPVSFAVRFRTSACFISDSTRQISIRGDIFSPELKAVGQI